MVSTLGVLYGFGEVAEDGLEYWTMFARDFTALSAFSFMIFNLLCAPCFAAMGAIKREMNNARWTWFAIGYLCVFAYTISLIVFQIGSFVNGGEFTVLTAAAIILLTALIYLLFRSPAKVKAETLSQTAAAHE